VRYRRLGEIARGARLVQTRAQNTPPFGMREGAQDRVEPLVVDP
jgi:hypothetical protein